MNFDVGVNDADGVRDVVCIIVCMVMQLCHSKARILQNLQYEVLSFH